MQPPDLSDIPTACHPAFSLMAQAGFYRSVRIRYALMGIGLLLIAGGAVIVGSMMAAIYQKAAGMLLIGAILAAILAVTFLWPAAFHRGKLREPGLQDKDTANRAANRVLAPFIEKCALRVLDKYAGDDAHRFATAWQARLASEGFYHEAAIWERVAKRIEEIEKGRTRLGTDAAGTL